MSEAPPVKRALTAEQKAALIAKLEHPWGHVELRCDGYDVALHVENIKPLQYAVVVYVNGQWRGSWLSAKNEHPEQKFMRRSEKRIHGPKLLRQMEKIYGKRRVAKDPDFKRTFVTFDPYFHSGRAAINHLCKVCDSIKIPTDIERLQSMPSTEGVPQ